LSVTSAALALRITAGAASAPPIRPSVLGEVEPSREVLACGQDHDPDALGRRRKERIEGGDQTVVNAFRLSGRLIVR
jgi:hypothetical protein